jgi:alpha-galactosidase
MWRISGDVWDRWEKPLQSLKGQILDAAAWAPYVQAGHWPDADMLPIGFLGPRPGGKGVPRQTKFTRDEQRTMLTFWSIFRSPLMMGGSLPSNDDWTTSLLTNAEVIAVDQHSKRGHPVMSTPTTVIWLASAEKGDDRYLAVFNIGDVAATTDRAWKDLGLNGNSYQVRDLWEHKDLASAKSLSVLLAPHASVLYRLRPAR